MLRQMYEDLRGQLENEVTFRTKNEEDLRNWFESKSEMLSQIQQRSEQATLDREKGIMT